MSGWWWLAACSSGSVQLEVTVGEGAGTLSEEVQWSVDVVDDGGCKELVVDGRPWAGKPIQRTLDAPAYEFEVGGGFVAEVESSASCERGGSPDEVSARASFTVLPGDRSDALDGGDVTAVLARDGSKLIGCGPDGDVVERSLDGGRAVHLDVPCGADTTIEAQSAAISGFVVRNDRGGGNPPRVTWVWRPPTTGEPEVLYDHVVEAGEVVFANLGVLLREAGGERIATLLSGAGRTELTLGPAADWPPDEFAGRLGETLWFVDADGISRSPSSREEDLGVRRTPGTHLYRGYHGSDVVQVVDPDGAFVILRDGRVEHRVPGATVVEIPGAPWGAFVTDADGVTWVAWGRALERRAPRGITVEYGNDDHWVGVTDDGDAVLGWLDVYGVLGEGLFDGARLLPTLPTDPAGRLSESNGWAVRDGVPYQLSLLQIAEVAGP